MFSDGLIFQQKQQSLNVLIAAGKVALDAPSPHRRSPAWAVQSLAEATYFQPEPDGFHPEFWLCHVFRMTSKEVGQIVRWDEHNTCWDLGGEYAVSGESILNDALFWQQNGLDMSRSPRDRRIYAEDEALSRRRSNAIELIEKSLMPLEGELLRRSFKIKTPRGYEARCFDVWLAQEKSGSGLDRLFHWALHDPSRPSHLACSSEPISNCELEGLLAPKYIPTDGCERRLISMDGVVV